MRVKHGQLDDRGHPYVEIMVSATGSPGSGVTLNALVDTGFSGFVSSPVIAASELRLQPHATTRYEMANGALCEPVPLARAFACVAGDSFAPGVVTISDNATVLMGVEFLRVCGKGLLMFSGQVILVDEKGLADFAAKQP